MFDKVKTSSQKIKLLNNLLIKTTHQKVLALFLANPSARLYGSEISKRVGISIGQTSKILGDLLKGGLVEKESQGKDGTVCYCRDRSGIATVQDLEYNFKHRTTDRQA